MKNITITVPEDVARWARVWAAKHDSSVSRLVGEMLTERMRQEEAYGASMRSYLDQSAGPLKGEGDAYPARSDLYR